LTPEADMTAVIWVVVVLVVLAAVGTLGYLATTQGRRRQLQQRFGPEYDRTVREHESRKEAEEELRARETRFEKLGIRPLDAESRSSYAKKWTEVQERFVDAPAFAVTEADTLVTAVMSERGYPTENFDQVVSDLSVEHGRTLDHYRQAHEISGRAARQQASTEELRQAMVHYRALFEELLGAGTQEAATAYPQTGGGYVSETDAARDGSFARGEVRRDESFVRDAEAERDARVTDAADADRDGFRDDYAGAEDRTVAERAANGDARAAERARRADEVEQTRAAERDRRAAEVADGDEVDEVRERERGARR